MKADEMGGQIQASFAAALLRPELPVPDQLVSYLSRVPEKRFGVYRNNVVSGLVNALATRFPATQRIVGEEFFRAMARIFVTQCPPRSPLLMRYGDEFPEFISTFEPAAGLAYLPDVARLEAARTRAYHAADRTPANPAGLQAIEAAELEQLRVTPHPSAEIIRSRHPIVTIWGMNAGDLPLGPIEDWRGEDALVVRPRFDVEVRKLPEGAAAFLGALFSGAPLGTAARVAQAECETFDLTANLAGLVTSGVVAAFLRPGERGSQP